MSELPLKIKHFADIPNFHSQYYKDSSEEALKRKALAIPFLQEFITPRPAKPRIVPSADGSLERILFTIPSCATTNHENNPLWKVYCDLLKKLPSYTRIIILTHECNHLFVWHWLEENGFSERIDIGHLPDYLDFTVWAEDGYVAVTDEDTKQTYLVEPHSFPRSSDELIAEAVSNFTEIKTIQSPLYFEGGNILAGDDFFFIGADYAVKTLGYVKEIITPKDGESKTDLIYRLYQEYFDTSKRLIFIGATIPVPTRREKDLEINGKKWSEIFYIKNKGGTVQPLFHIDMFITFGGRQENGKYQLIVGDPRMAAEILGQKVSPYAMPEVFDNIANNLQRLGFEVMRNPLPLTYLDDPEERERYWYFATANNSLVEIKSQQDKTIWIPTYGYGPWEELKKTDEANKAFYESLGFKVITLGDFHPFAEHSGSVHCIKKYISRGKRQ